MKFTINSRKMGREFTFTRPGAYYIYVDVNGQPGSLGRQICKGGSLTGTTLGYRGDNDESFRSICKTWYKAYLKG